MTGMNHEWIIKSEHIVGEMVTTTEQCVRCELIRSRQLFTREWNYYEFIDGIITEIVGFKNSDEGCAERVMRKVLL